MQKERDDIEGDVMNFDNGDLVRMKEKTRGNPFQISTSEQN